MEPRLILNTEIKKMLIDEFGISVANIIILSNSQKLRLSLLNLNKQDYLGLVRGICEDPKLIARWGLTRCQEQEALWESLVEKE